MQYPFDICFCLLKSQIDWWKELFMEPAELPMILDNPFSEMDSKEHLLEKWYKVDSALGNINRFLPLGRANFPIHTQQQIYPFPEGEKKNQLALL